MYPPKPTADPYTMVQNMWASLRRAAIGHWGEEATVDPSDTGFKVTLRLKEKIPKEQWASAGRYIRGYAKASRWKVDNLSHQRGYIAFNVEYIPPIKKQQSKRPTRGQARQRTVVEKCPGRVD